MTTTTTKRRRTKNRCNPVRPDNSGLVLLVRHIAWSNGSLHNCRGEARVHSREETWRKLTTLPVDQNFRVLCRERQLIQPRKVKSSHRLPSVLALDSPPCSFFRQIVQVLQGGTYGFLGFFEEIFKFFSQVTYLTCSLSGLTFLCCPCFKTARARFWDFYQPRSGILDSF